MFAFRKSIVRRLIFVLALTVIVITAALLKYHYAMQRLLEQGASGRTNSFQPFASRQFDGVDVRTFLDARVALLFVSDHFPPTNEFLASFRSNRVITGVKSSGCAAAIDRRGYFLTAAHCVDAKEFRMFGREFKTNGIVLRIMTARVVWQGDHGKGEPDLAILRIKRPIDCAFDLADEAENNAPVMAVGMLRKDTTVFATMEFLGGTITGVQQRTGSEAGAIITTDVPLQPGDSGGPLVDTKGRLVAIDTEAFYPPGHGLLPGGYLSHSEHPDWKWVKEIVEKDFRDTGTADK